MRISALLLLLFPGACLSVILYNDTVSTIEAFRQCLENTATLYTFEVERTTLTIEPKEERDLDARDSLLYRCTSELVLKTTLSVCIGSSVRYDSDSEGSDVLLYSGPLGSAGIFLGWRK